MPEILETFLIFFPDMHWKMVSFSESISEMFCKLDLLSWSDFQEWTVFSQDFFNIKKFARSWSGSQTLKTA